ncbi:MAG: hypothetical protein A3A44_00045 [Candidatus Sungbacteria bacterium RIFCSPLOWO2_01_FULL_60_25]|uniref:5'-deoxynucleotidase n=1 Tax=Candidatus Sungbacteria bacterium RIFCSPLOWO2_01_FULL_60_25 TaxID=1802281 RepID=A0A1G2LBE7_9BACT|nr:MAG: hypothetical protein A3A44_00045 [Candidatus Sungbacteria bacterium RIFCSPLOWO2_01_FULL_60_25]
MESLLKFLDLIHSLQLVRRAVLARGEDRHENDLEHSYQLAMAGRYVATSERLTLDRDRILRYALAHDVVETYAGDTPTYGGNHQEQARREADAIARIRQEFPEFDELHEAIDGYERREDPESKFVFALDKLLPVLNNYLDGGRNWKSNGITLAMLMDHKAGRISTSPEIKKHYDAVLEKIRESERELFADPEAHEGSG